jgi:hypothetical protein
MCETSSTLTAISQAAIKAINEINKRAESLILLPIAARAERSSS